MFDWTPILLSAPGEIDRPLDPLFLQLFQPFPIAVRIPVIHERGVARVSPNHTPGMFDWTPILLSAPGDLANICNQSICVGTVGAIELFDRVQVSKMVPVEYQYSRRRTFGIP